MFTISVETRFTASHQLTRLNGSKEPLHCHNWVVIADVSSDRLNALSFVMDFHRLKAMVDSIVGVFDSRCLEEFDYFQASGSSAEVVAKYIYEELTSKLPGGLNLDSITVVEEPNCSAKYSGCG